MDYNTAGLFFVAASNVYDTNKVAGEIQFRTRDNSGGSGIKLIVKADGEVGIGTTSPSEKLDINSDAIRIRTAQTPASAGAAGTQGMICWDASYIYVCTATNTWKRTAIATW